MPIHDFDTLGIHAPREVLLGRSVREVRVEALTQVSDRLERDRRWLFTATWPILEHDEFQVTDALCEVLAGDNLLNLPLRSYRQRLGGGTGLPRAAAAAPAGATQFTTKDWTGTSPYLILGDFFGLVAAPEGGGEPFYTVHRVTKIVAIGDLQIRFQPQLRFGIATNTALLVLGSSWWGQPHLLCTVELDAPDDVSGHSFPSPWPKYFDGLSMTFLEARRSGLASLLVPPTGIIVTRDFDLRWNLKSAVSTDFDIRWPIATPIKVTTDFDLRWYTVLNTVSADFNLRWNVGEILPVSANFDLRWNVIGQVGTNFSLAWDVFSPVEPPLSWDDGTLWDDGTGWIEGAAGIAAFSDGTFFRDTPTVFTTWSDLD
jgi:hypothetical protein